MLKDALARIPADDEEDIDRAMDDLKRMCCSTSYMFMYSQVRCGEWVLCARILVPFVGGVFGGEGGRGEYRVFRLHLFG